ncbi:hypothetical protein Acr_28g0006360 [Actinidia rufa]|uniref:Uncharacterized protein n=1 Tax=Actinidia rufa TaxID=165716 RepID=A0A7J0HAE7_9ERIC|nr:hypothetical protein Acr_28g0006360 [Actinidia rufa]
MGTVRELQEAGVQIKEREVGDDTWAVREAKRRKDQAKKSLKNGKSLFSVGVLLVKGKCRGNKSQMLQLFAHCHAGVREAKLQVRGRDVRVTPDSIVSYLNYTQPQAGNSEYPREDYPSLTEAEYAQAVYERPEEFRAGQEIYFDSASSRTPIN